MKKVLLIVKNNRKIINDKEKRLQNRRGSELAQTVLITAIMVVIVATLFFPQIKTLFSSAMEQITVWFNNVLGDISNG